MSIRVCSFVVFDFFKYIVSNFPITIRSQLDLLSIISCEHHKVSKIIDWYLNVNRLFLHSFKLFHRLYYTHRLSRLLPRTSILLLLFLYFYTLLRSSFNEETSLLTVLCCVVVVKCEIQNCVFIISNEIWYLDRRLFMSKQTTATAPSKEPSEREVKFKLITAIYVH